MVGLEVVGKSRSTEPAAHLAINTTQQLNGLVLTSSMSEPNDKGVSVLEMELGKITILTLIVAHRNDGCHVTLPKSAKGIVKLLTHVKKVEVKIFSGDVEKSFNPYRAKTHHGFLGIESKVIDYIAQFIKAN